MTNTINAAFRVSKMNFVWSVRLNEEKKNFETQLNGVSKAISNIAENLDEEIENEDDNLDKKEEIVQLLKQKEILVQDISINKKENERYKIELYIENNEKENIGKTILTILEKVLEEKLIVQSEKEIKKENIIKYEVVSDDKYLLDLAHSIAIKDGVPVSGDSLVQTKLKDGKYLVAISDGMGSGAEARKSSQIVVSMLKRLLKFI